MSDTLTNEAAELIQPVEIQPDDWTKLLLYFEQNGIQPSFVEPTDHRNIGKGVEPQADIVTYYSADEQNTLAFYVNRANHNVNRVDILYPYNEQVGQFAVALHKIFLHDNTVPEVETFWPNAWEVPEPNDTSLSATIAKEAQRMLSIFNDKRVIRQNGNLYFDGGNREVEILSKYAHVYKESGGTFTQWPEYTRPTIQYVSPTPVSLSFVDAENKVRVTIKVIQTFGATSDSANFASPDNRFMGVQDFTIEAVEPINN